MVQTYRADLNNAYQEKVLVRLEKQLRALAIFVDQQLVERTPVDTGRARANWQVSLNAPITTTVSYDDDTPKDPSFTPSRNNDALNVTTTVQFNDTIFISNNLPYIQKLNDGSSVQAPSGFVEAVVDQAKRAVQ